MSAFYCSSPSCFAHVSEEYQLLCTECDKRVAEADYGERFIRPLYTTQEQRDAYARDGHLIIEDILNQAQLEEWRTRVDAAVATRGTDWILPTKNQADFLKPATIPAEFYHAVFTQRVNLRDTDVGMRELLHGIKHTLGRIAAELMEVKSVRFYDDEALIKEPFASPTLLHYDGPAWSHDNPNGVSAWFGLDDVTIQNGAMYMLSGSHKLVRQHFDENGGKFLRIAPDPSYHSKMNDIFSRKPKCIPAAKNLPISPVTMRAGSVSFHSGMTIHGAGPNMTHGRRRAMVFALMQDGTVYNGHNDIFSDEQFAQHVVGEPLVSSMFPLAYTS